MTNIILFPGQDDDPLPKHVRWAVDFWIRFAVLQIRIDRIAAQLTQSAA